MDIQDLLAQLQSPCQISRSAYPKIQMVAHHLRHRKDFADYYSPRMVSLGPIHHGEPHLQLGEKYKLMWASMYVQREQERAQLLHGKIAENIDDLKDLYNEDAIGHFNDQQLELIWFLDGCALLQILKNPDILDPEPLGAKVDQLALVRQDALLLENQLPFHLLHLLSDVSDTELLQDMDKFLRCHHLSTEKPGQNPAEGDSQQHVIRQNPAEGDSHQHVIDIHPAPSQKSPPAHLLDELRRNVLAGFPPPQKKLIVKGGTITHRNMKELKAAGIQVKRRDSECPIDITFSSYCLSGELRLPELVVDDTTAPTYLNLMAYEVCPDFENNYEISSYVEFLDSLIDHADDVKELRKARVLHNGLGSDKEVAKLFNVISNDVVPNAEIYGPLRVEMEKHYKQKHKTWYAQAMDTYFSNPWSIIAVIAASLVLLLTSTQTWFTAFPASH